MACMCEQLFFRAKFICREKIYISSFFCVQASTRILISSGHNCEWHNRWICGHIIPSCNWAFTSQWKGSAAPLLSPSPHKLVVFILTSGVVFWLAGWFGSVGTCPQLWAHMCCLQKQMPGLPIKCKWCRHIQQHRLQSTCACSYWDGRIHSWFFFNSSKSSPDTSRLGFATSLESSVKTHNVKKFQLWCNQPIGSNWDVTKNTVIQAKDDVKVCNLWLCCSSLTPGVWCVFLNLDTSTYKLIQTAYMFK